MVHNCSACKKRFIKGVNRSFHQFPRDARMRELWISILGRGNFNTTRNKSICSDHFTSSDFVIKPSGIRYLKKEAFPSGTISTSLSTGTAMSLSFNGKDTNSENIPVSLKSDEEETNNGKVLVEQLQPADKIKDFLETDSTTISEVSVHGLGSTSSMKLSSTLTASQTEYISAESNEGSKTVAKRQGESRLCCFGDRADATVSHNKAWMNWKITKNTISARKKRVRYLQLSKMKLKAQISRFSSLLNSLKQQCSIIESAENIIHLQPQPQLPPLQPLIQQPLPPVVNTEDKEKKKPTKLNNKKDPKAETGKQCLTCNKVFGTTTKLSRHMKTHSTDMPYKCKVCSKAFSHSGNYKIHLRMHTDERPFRCTVCDKGCRQAQDLEKHMRTHTGEKPHACHICPRAFSTSSNLIAHIRTHTGERPYVCCVCQKAFCQSNELTKHMRVHTGEKSHICEICNKGFNGSSTLIVHRRSHTGERPYVCSICNKGFAQSSCLAVHMKRHNNEKNYNCTQCDSSFITNSELKEHLTSHMNDKQYNCNICNKKFNRLSDFNKHVRMHSSTEES